MQIFGIEKLSLLDYDGKLACTLWTAKCNFRCPFCHNSHLVEGQLPSPIPQEEIFAYLDKRKNVLDAVCITGGEPTLYADLPDFIANIKKMGYLTKLDTNGTNPAMLKKLIVEEQVDYIAMDVKNCAARYAETAGTEHLDYDKIKESIEIIKTAKDYEFRTTIVAEFHDEEGISQMADEIGKAKAFYFQHFVDRETCIYGGLHEIPEERAKNFVKIFEEKQVGKTELRGY